MPQILIVDDDPAVRSPMREVLTRAGFQVAEAANGNDAIRQLHQASVGLVILDMFKPQSDGIDALLDLRRRCPGVKVMALSGEPSLGIAERLGAEETLAKPFTASELISAVQSMLAG